jgi:Double zinc ribbon
VAAAQPAVAGGEQAHEIEVRTRPLPALRPSSVPTVAACHSSPLCFIRRPEKRGVGPARRLHAAGVGILSSVTAIRDFAIFLAVVFWLALAYGVHKDVRRRVEEPFLVFVATLLGLALPYIGPAVYLLFRPAETLEDTRSRRVELQALEQQLARSQATCPVCAAPVQPDYLVCPLCTTTLRQSCERCAAPLEPLWQVCPYCTRPIEPSQADLDAALTAEAEAIASVDEDAIPLVPQPERHVAGA